MIGDAPGDRKAAEATGCLIAARELADALAPDHLALRIDHALAAAADPVLKRT